MISNDYHQYHNANVYSLLSGPVVRAPGARWLIRGPSIYIPPVEVKVLDQR